MARVECMALPRASTTHAAHARSGISICEEISAPGHGSGAMNRWFYDNMASECKSFTYTGYGGNRNNFLTKLDCDTVCGPKAEGGRPLATSKQTAPTLYTSTPMP